MSTSVLALFAFLIACGGETPAPAAPADAPAAPSDAPAADAPAAPPADATPARKVLFTEPASGAKVKSPFKVVFGVEGMEVRPAGELAENTGHHHLIINGSAIEAGVMVPKDERHIHYGAGQTEAELTLEPGEYSLTMQFADGNHMSYGPVMSTTIQVTVEP